MAKREYEQYPLFDESQECCPTHGVKLQEVETRTTCDPKTGELITHYAKSCVVPKTVHFLFWRFRVDRGCGHRRQGAYDCFCY